MAKAADDTVLDGTLNVIDNASRMVATSAQPANFAGIAAVALADVVMTPGTDFTDANGDTNGRKTTVAAKSGVNVDSSGTATHITLDDGATLLFVTTCTSQALTSGNTVNFPAWKVEVGDPT
jgi:hypothetical protein